MQKGLFSVVQVLFFAAVVFGLTLVVMGSSGSVGLPVALGAVLFFLGLGAFRHPGRKGEDPRRRMVDMRNSLMTNKGGAASLAVIAVLGVVIAALAVRA